MFYLTPHERRAVFFIGTAFFLGICCDIVFKLYPPGFSALRVLDEPRALAKIDINHAPYTELLSVPGIGPSIAARIVYAREKKAFVSLEDLRGVKVFSKKTLMRAAGRLIVGAP